MKHESIIQCAMDPHQMIMKKENRKQFAGSFEPQTVA